MKCSLFKEQVYDHESIVNTLFLSAELVIYIHKRAIPVDGSTTYKLSLRSRKCSVSMSHLTQAVLLTHRSYYISLFQFRQY